MINGLFRYVNNSSQVLSTREINCRYIPCSCSCVVPRQLYCSLVWLANLSRSLTLVFLPDMNSLRESVSNILQVTSFIRTNRVMSVNLDSAVYNIPGHILMSSNVICTIYVPVHCLSISRRQPPTDHSPPSPSLPRHVAKPTCCNTTCGAQNQICNTPNFPTFTKVRLDPTTKPENKPPIHSPTPACREPSPPRNRNRNNKLKIPGLYPSFRPLLSWLTLV